MSKYDVSRIDESMMRVSKESAADFNMSQPVVLCPGVKIASRANIFLSDSESDDEELGNGFGPNVQTLSGDIEHLSIVFPGENRKLLHSLLMEAIAPELWLPSEPDVNVVEERLREIRLQKYNRGMRRSATQNSPFRPASWMRFGEGSAETMTTPHSGTPIPDFLDSDASTDAKSDAPTIFCAWENCPRNRQSSEQSGVIHAHSHGSTSGPSSEEVFAKAKTSSRSLFSTTSKQDDPGYPSRVYKSHPMDKTHPRRSSKDQDEGSLVFEPVQFSGLPPSTAVATSAGTIGSSNASTAALLRKKRMEGRQLPALWTEMNLSDAESIGDARVSQVGEPVEGGHGEKKEKKEKKGRKGRKGKSGTRHVEDADSETQDADFSLTVGAKRLKAALDPSRVHDEEGLLSAELAQSEVSGKRGLSGSTEDLYLSDHPSSTPVSADMFLSKHHIEISPSVHEHNCPLPPLPYLWLLGAHHLPPGIACNHPRIPTGIAPPAEFLKEYSEVDDDISKWGTKLDDLQDLPVLVADLVPSALKIGGSSVQTQGISATPVTSPSRSNRGHRGGRGGRGGRAQSLRDASKEALSDAGVTSEEMEYSPTPHMSKVHAVQIAKGKKDSRDATVDEDKNLCYDALYKACSQEIVNNKRKRGVMESEEEKPLTQLEERATKKSPSASKGKARPELEEDSSEDSSYSAGDSEHDSNLESSTESDDDSLVSSLASESDINLDEDVEGSLSSSESADVLPQKGRRPRKLIAEAKKPDDTRLTKRRMLTRPLHKKRVPFKDLPIEESNESDDSDFDMDENDDDDASSATSLCDSDLDATERPQVNLLESITYMESDDSSFSEDSDAMISDGDESDAISEDSDSNTESESDDLVEDDEDDEEETISARVKRYVKQAQQPSTKDRGKRNQALEKTQVLIPSAASKKKQGEAKHTKKGKAVVASREKAEPRRASSRATSRKNPPESGADGTGKASDRMKNATKDSEQPSRSGLRRRPQELSKTKAPSRASTSQMKETSSSRVASEGTRKSKRGKRNRELISLF